MIATFLEDLKDHRRSQGQKYKLEYIILLVHPINAYLNIVNGRFYSHFKMSSIKGFINWFFDLKW